jgi:hypothetical protein
MERFSPLFTQPETYVPRFRAPEASYRYVYPAGMDLDRIAYFFEYELADGLPDTAYAGVQEAVAEWSQAWSEKVPGLTYWSAPDFVQIYDSRHDGGEGTYTFEGALAQIYQAVSDRAMSAAAVRRRLGLSLPVEAVDEVFQEFASHGLMFLDGSLALALAIPAVSGR